MRRLAMRSVSPLLSGGTRRSSKRHLDCRHRRNNAAPLHQLRWSSSTQQPVLGRTRRSLRLRTSSTVRAAAPDNTQPSPTLSHDKRPAAVDRCAPGGVPRRSGSSRPSGPALGRDDEFGGGGDCFHVGVGLFDLVEVVAAVDRHSGGPSARRGGTLGTPLLAGSVGAGSFTLLLVVI